MSDADAKRRGFFMYVFGEAEGYLCVAFRNAISGSFQEEFYQYPEALDEALKDINEKYVENDVYFCPHLLTVPKRVKNNVSECPCAWSDLDECHPDNLKVEPTITVMTSEGRYQAYWKFDGLVSPTDAEAISKRIAYEHKDEGADTSGWDLTQLLRVPLTYNHKYREEAGPHTVMVTSANSKTKYSIDDFEAYPLVEHQEHTVREMPDELPDAEEVLDENKLRINPRVWKLIEETPTDDWSAKLWELELSLFEAQLTAPEVFTVAYEAACNKYARDDRDPSFLWKEVLRAEKTVQDRNAPIQQQEFLSAALKEKPLLTEEEREYVRNNPGFVEDYIEWAKSIGDAAWQYHQAGAFIALSTLLSGYVELPTSFGSLRTNLWFMILADTTLTRKTTAMDLAMDMVREVDSDCILATDGSIEGLLTSLSMRPGRASVFLRDEFTGLIEAMTRKDYMAGMMEALTKLYDGKYQKRVLKREVIEVKDPILVLFAGGIKNRMHFLLKHEHVTSGFVPRFIFVTAESDITRVKPIGPPTNRTEDRRRHLIERLFTMRQHYIDQLQGTPQATLKFEMTDEAWIRYNRFDNEMVEYALKSQAKELYTPYMARLAINGLKAAVLLSAARADGEQLVTEDDIIRAFYYVEQWREYGVEILSNIGNTTEEQLLQRIARRVEEVPGIMRSDVMQSYHLTARQADQIFATLEQRGLILRKRAGRTERLIPQTGEPTHDKESAGSN